MVGVNGWEFVLLLVIGVVILGPERLPEYAAKLGRLVRQARALAEGARGQLREQMGPEFDEINWRQYDPRQYDPRRIVREALLDPNPLDSTGNGSGPASGASKGYDATQPTPYDLEAT
jgi:sec-independent protein translocase protein TatB